MLIINSETASDENSDCHRYPSICSSLFATCPHSDQGWWCRAEILAEMLERVVSLAGRQLSCNGRGVVEARQSEPKKVVNQIVFSPQKVKSDAQGQRVGFCIVNSICDYYGKLCIVLLQQCALSCYNKFRLHLHASSIAAEQDTNSMLNLPIVHGLCEEVDMSIARKAKPDNETCPSRVFLEFWRS
jgi:hypothetical protein